MLNDGVTARDQESGAETPSAQVLDVASLLLESVRVPTSE